tara:strand:+ start:260 stop:1252 length:993 start_codon:yes stop_codon:yes gene_type:complete
MKKRFPKIRMRRLRTDKFTRNLVREQSLSCHDLIQPLFVMDGKDKEQRIKSMPSMSKMTIDKIVKEVKILKNLGIQAIALFPNIDNKKKSNDGKEAYNPNGLIQNCISEIKDKIEDIGVISDVALDPYTSHGQDGIRNKKGMILNDETIEVLVKQAISHAKAGADIVAPSDMMDGRVRNIREELENEGFKNTKILSYAAKYSSNFYGPFRDAVGSNKNLGKSNKDTYQMDYANKKESFREIELDINEGADIIMIKPAMPYLDIISDINSKFNVPIFVYQVSGEYSMIKAASEKKWLNEKKIVLESLMAMKRAGANAIFTYFAKQASKWLT